MALTDGFTRTRIAAMRAFGFGLFIGLGVDVSPHLFRTAGASTAALYGRNHPHLASALLNHRDSRVTEEHYNHSANLSAGEEYGLITRSYRKQL
jgi:integrase